MIAVSQIFLTFTTLFFGPHFCFYLTCDQSVITGLYCSSKYDVLYLNDSSGNRLMDNLCLENPSIAFNVVSRKMRCK